MAEYYAQRASAGLIIAEGTNISPQGRGYAFTPGIYDDAQVEGWRPVTEAVHARGGRIFPAALACRAGVASLAAARRGPAGGPFGDPSGGHVLYHDRLPSPA